MFKEGIFVKIYKPSVRGVECRIQRGQGLDPEGSKNGEVRGLRARQSC